MKYSHLIKNHVLSRQQEVEKLALEWLVGHAKQLATKEPVTFIQMGTDLTDDVVNEICSDPDFKRGTDQDNHGPAWITITWAPL